MKLFSSKGFLIFLIAVFLLVVVALGKESYQYFKTKKEIDDLKNRIENLEKENKELSETQEFFETEGFLEEQGRLKLNLVRPGEKVIIVKDSQEVSFTEDEVEEKEVANILKWWKYFFGYRGL
ncbi:MAG: hypothetical protein GF387_01530 [Candidatus Portnoybacteria bacterium]|nr:hypothetical protein [Candidatus Portnoybacteria bacterium]